MLKELFTIFIILFFVSSCKKVKDNQIQAGIYVKQYKTNTPIANALVLITRGTPGSGVGTQIVDTLYTDSNVRVSYNKTVDENYMYYAEAYKEGYFDTHNQQVDVRPGEKNFTTTIYMYAHSWVKLHVKNVIPYDQFDWFRLSTYCTSNFYIQGMNIDTTFFFCDYGFEFMGDFEHGYSYTVSKNNSTIQHDLYFTPIPHDTLTININY